MASTVALHHHLKDNVAEAGMDVCPHRLVDLHITAFSILEVTLRALNCMQLLAIITNDMIR